MDPTKPSHVNSGGGNDSLMEESWVLWRDSTHEGERQRDTETREPDVVDGTLAAAEITYQQRGSADKNRSNMFVYQRQTKLKVVTDFSTVSKGVSVGGKPRAALKQVLFSQSEKNPPSEEQGQLDSLKQDLGTYAVPANLNWMWKEESRGTILEKNWTEIVASHSTMSKMQRYQQEALWEFVHTELAYINKLIIIKDLVIAALVNLHRNGFLQEVTPELLFSNLPSILKAHQLFWQEVIYPMLHEVRRTGMPFDPMMLEAGCLQFHQRFSSYQHYCWEEENSLGFSRRQLESNPHFFIFVQWVETHPQCYRMRLGDMQAKPHQRITKYPLLLKAVLKTTQDPRVQHTLRGMLSSVKSFLESINDYLKLKDEELALSISAQRVEGYEVEGINEEIDKHVRDICQFDLTCPIRGVGPRVVRELLLEENLKIRWRKDSKLEVVALLFSDVLLMTKVQKKGERLKVVQPPLALDRTYCIALKDGCSFVLVEVGELQSAMNVYIFTASTSESCSMWVSTIQQAKETLKSWRETETNRKLANWKIQQLEAKPVTEAKTDDMATGEQLLMQSGEETFVDELKEECLTPQSINGMPSSEEAEEQPPDEVASYKTVASLFNSQPNNNDCKVSDKCFTDQQQAVKRYEWIEMGVRRQEIGIHRVEEEKIVKRAMTKERKLALNDRAKSAPLLDHFNHFIAADPLRYSTTGPYTLLQGEYPDIDYPMNEDSSSQPIYQPTLSSEFSRIPEKGGTSTKRDTDSQSVNQDTWTNSSTSTSPEAWSLKNLKSPGLRRKRLINTHSVQTSPQLFQHSGPTWSPSLSNSDSNYDPNTNRNSVSSENSSDSRQVLKLGSLKPNQEMSWNMDADTQTLSEPELSDLSINGKWPKLKTQRRVSISNIKGGHELRLHSRSLYTLPQEKDTKFHLSRYNPSGHPSTLEGLLERAKERVRERDGLKRDKSVKSATLRKYPPPSPSFSITPSPSTSDGDRDTEWEEEVELMRHRALTVSKGWKEQLVDEDEDEQRDSAVFTDGVNVDWPGWCFDDDEVMNRVNPGEEGLLEGISRSLSLWNCHRLSVQEDGEYSQV